MRELNDSSLSWDRTHYFDESNFRTDVIWDNESDRLVQSIAALNLVEQRQNEMLAYIAKVLPHAVAAKLEGQDAAKLEEDQDGMPNAEFETQPDATRRFVGVRHVLNIRTPVCDFEISVDFRLTLGEGQYQMKYASILVDSLNKAEHVG